MDRASPVPSTEGHGRESLGLEGLERLAWVMDHAFRIPGTTFRVGVDALIGLLPVGGDFLAGVVQVGIVLVALFYFRVPRAVAARMATNVLLDTTIGAIPLVGDAFDAVFKANTRNLRLLTEVEDQRRRDQPVETTGSLLYVAAIAAGMLGVLALVLIGFVAVVAWVAHRLGA
jgi:hypothetical protein